MANRRPLLSIQRQVEIARVANRLVREHGTDGRVDPEKVARAEGIGFRYEAFPENFDGVLLHDLGGFYVVCNDRRFRRGSTRARFTFAHELGHYFIPDHRAALEAGDWGIHYSRVEYASNDIREAEADCFAANLLLSEEPVRGIFAKVTGSGVERIEKLAGYFGTSLTATAYRALRLGLFPAPAAILRWDSLGIQIGRLLSETTVVIDRKYLALATVPPTDSLTMRMIESLGSGSTSGLTHVMGWFTGLHGYDRDDQRLICEEVKSLGQYGWITLIHSETQHDLTLSGSIV
jgi:hypothetical protein